MPRGYSRPLYVLHFDHHTSSLIATTKGAIGDCFKSALATDVPKEKGATPYSWLSNRRWPQRVLKFSRGLACSKGGARFCYCRDRTAL
jgi:hypothetical protein